LAFCLVYVVGPAVAQEYQSKKLADAALANVQVPSVNLYPG
jgi:hypothetical protein